ncbi:hypothetical protein B0H17DRAFT_1144254 [Mycena rosella]|uniref:Major facilitator superfamily (MFS) profile domain-containing protein n=1 Tax=Mycena rosella TaxID=1033263 RepID=A0AAD7G5W8_MYCRO|nr:hypothetical protein B0H17DRAFT_1144254 [Mycena rosella]
MENDIDEYTALLSKPHVPPTCAPLSMGPVVILMLVFMCDPLATHSISSYINQVRSFTTKALISDRLLQWSRASDRFGRKSILLVGLFGTIVSTLCFGLSRKFWILVVSRCLMGLLNGNLGSASIVLRAAQHSFGPGPGVVESTVGDITDSSNRAAGFVNSYTSLADGPLSKVSYDVGRAPGKFGTISGWVSCTVAGSLPQYIRWGILEQVPVLLAECSHNRRFVTGFFRSAGVFDERRHGPGEIVLLRQAHSPVRLQADVRRGTEHLSAHLRAFPVTSLVAKRTGLTPVVWTFVGFILALSAFLDTSFEVIPRPLGAILMFVAAAAPKSSRGAVNGLMHTAGSLARAIARIMATFIFSLSVEENLLGGYAVYLVLFTIASLARLPADLSEDVEDGTCPAQQIVAKI